MTEQIPADALFGSRPLSFLITGGTGFIGERLTASLLAAGHAVTILSRRQPPAGAAHRIGLDFVSDLGQLPRDAAVDVVVNLAGARILGLPWTQRRRKVLLESRLGVTERVVRWIAGATHKPRLLISASGIGYYGVSPPGDDRWLTEDSPPRPVFMSQLCEQWERAAAGARTSGVAVACLRFGVVLGDGGALPMLLLPVRFGLGGPMGGGRQWMSWVHIDDLLRAMSHVARHAGLGQAGAWNVTAPQSVRQVEFARTAAAVLHRPAFLPTPAWPVRLALGEQADLLLGSQRVAPARLLAEGFQFVHPELAGALAALTGKPMPVRDA
jgi:uncharacterized protein (TIGR01777 family)